MSDVFVDFGNDLQAVGLDYLSFLKIVFGVVLVGIIFSLIRKGANKVRRCEARDKADRTGRYSR